MQLLCRFMRPSYETLKETEVTMYLKQGIWDHSLIQKGSVFEEAPQAEALSHRCAEPQ